MLRNIFFKSPNIANAYSIKNKLINQCNAENNIEFIQNKEENH